MKTQPHDNANTPQRRSSVRAAPDRGALAGVRFLVADAFGSAPSVDLGTGGAARRAASVPIVQRLADAGARFAGTAPPDVSPHPVSGPPAATEGAGAEFTLGIDTVGSLLTPAALRGAFAARTSHWSLSMWGVAVSSPAFDAIAWSAAEADILQRVGRALGFHTGSRAGFQRIHAPADAFGCLGAAGSRILVGAVERLAGALGVAVHRTALTLAYESLDDWASTVQRRLAAQARGRPDGGLAGGALPGVAAGPPPDAAQERQARVRCGEIRSGLLAGLEAGDLLVLPTAPDPAPGPDAPESVVADFHRRCAALGSPAAIGGLPAVTLPAAPDDQPRMGLTLIGAPGTDGPLLATAARLGRSIQLRRR